MLTPKENTLNFINIGVSKANLSISSMISLSILAGMFIAVAGAGATVASVNIVAQSVAKLVGACIFPTGLALVVLSGAELFTGNSLMSIGWMSGKVKLSRLLINWITVYFGNIIGSVIVAALLVYGGTFHMFNNELVNSVVSIANSKCSLSFIDGVCRGILCNILVCMAVYMAGAAKTVAGKIIAVFLPIMLFVLCGFEHCVANMYYISAGMLTLINKSYFVTGYFYDINIGNAVLKNLLPVTIGNILGGVLFVSLPLWVAHVKSK